MSASPMTSSSAPWTPKEMRRKAVIFGYIGWLTSQSIGVRTITQVVRASLDERPGRVRFVVDCYDPISQDRLEHVGYLAIGPDRFATRWFPAEAGALRHFGCFAASLEAMVL